MWKETDTGLVYCGNGTTWDIFNGRGQVLKTGDETVNNSNVLQDDDHLLFPIEPNEIWWVELFLLAEGASNTADWLFGFTGPTGCTADWEALGKGSDGTGFGLVAVGTGTASSLVRTIAQSVAVGASNGKNWIELAGRFKADASHAGNVQFQWAQNTATAEDSKLLTGSFMRLQRVV